MNSQLWDYQTDVQKTFNITSIEINILAGPESNKYRPHNRI